MPPFITQHTIVAYLEDLPGVLTRVTTLVRRRGYNIASLAVGGTEKRGVSRLTLVFDADADGARRTSTSSSTCSSSSTRRAVKRS